MSGFNFEGMSNLKKSRGGSGGGFKPSYNLPLRLEAVHLANEKAATPSKDTLTGYIMFDPADPITVPWGLDHQKPVTVRLRERPAPSDAAKVPLEVFDLVPGKKVKGRYKVHQYAAIVAEDAKLLSDGTIECGWIKVMEYEHKEVPEGMWLHIGHVSVGYLNIPEESTGRYPNQERFVHFPEHSRPMTGMGQEALDNFKSQVSSLLADRSAAAGGRPTAIVRLINFSNVGQPDSSMSAIIKLAYDNGTPLSPEETVERWMAHEDNAQWVGFIQAADAIASSNGLLEVWPAWAFRAGKMATDNEVKKKTEGKFHTAEDFSAPMIDAGGNPMFRDNGRRMRNYGLIAEGMHQVMQMEPREDGTREWVANQTYTLDRFPAKLYSLDDLPTPLITEDCRKQFEANAVKRVEEKRAERNARKAGNDASNDAGRAADNASDQGQDFGDGAPDPAAGQFRPRV